MITGGVVFLIFWTIFRVWKLEYPCSWLSGRVLCGKSSNLHGKSTRFSEMDDTQDVSTRTVRGKVTVWRRGVVGPSRSLILGYGPDRRYVIGKYRPSRHPRSLTTLSLHLNASKYSPRVASVCTDSSCCGLSKLT